MLLVSFVAQFRLWQPPNQQPALQSQGRHKRTKKKTRCYLRGSSGEPNWNLCSCLSAPR